MNNIINQASYLRTTRDFPEEMHMMSVQMNRAYLEIANAVNNSIGGIFPTNSSAITKESWFITNARQQSLRKVFTFTSTASIRHNIPNFTEINYFTRMWGQYTDGTNWYGLIPASNTAIAGQISFYLTPTNITFASGAGAPALSSGIIILEWMSQI